MKKLEINQLETTSGGKCVESTAILIAVGAGIIIGGLLTGGIGAMVIMSYAGMTAANSYNCA